MLKEKDLIFKDVDAWYVIQTKPQKEHLVYEQLKIRKLEAYYPRIRVKVVNPRARKIKSYFPGYLFVHTNLNQSGTSALQWIPGATGLIGYGGEPAFVPDSLLQAIRKRIDQINHAKHEQTNDLSAGDMVAITSGSFAGYRAIFDSHLPGHERVRVLLQMLQDKQVCVVLSKGELERTNLR
jgi:transcriptional antiterminator RfaH